MTSDKLPPKGHLSKQFMAVALTLVMGAGAILGVAAPAQAADWENPIPNTTNSVITQMPGQVLNQVLNDTINGGRQGAGEIVKVATKQAGQQAGNEVGNRANQALQKTVNDTLGKIFKR